MGKVCSTGKTQKRTNTQPEKVEQKKTEDDNALSERAPFQSPRPVQIPERTEQTQKLQPSKADEEAWKKRSPFQSPRAVVPAGSESPEITYNPEQA